MALYMAKAIEIRDLVYRYPNTPNPILEDINLDINYGEFILITGPSGGGKSTLCRILTGLIPHVYGGELKGSIYVDGKDIMGEGIESIIGRVGVVFQNPENQIVNMIVEEEIAFGLENLGLDPNVIDERIREVSNFLSIEHLLDRSTVTLSGGEAQKVVLASILALKPKILLLDEPLAHLDPVSEMNLIQLLRRLHETLETTIVVFEHRLSEIIKYVDRVIILNKRIIDDGKPREVLLKLFHSGLEIPPISEVAIKIGINPLPLSVEEALPQIRNMINGVSMRSNIHNEHNGVQHKDRDYVIDIRNLWYTYPNGRTVLRNINIKVERGAFVALIGANGAGKTTLIKHLNGLLKPTRGDVIVCGKNTKEYNVAELSKYVGIVFQNPLHQFFSDTVLEEAAFAAKLRGMEDAYERAQELLERFGLIHLLNKSPYEISVGEQRRLAIISILVYEPPIIVLDEPTAGIDYRLKMELLNIINTLLKMGKTVIISSHDIEFLAKAKPDKIVVIDRGQIVAEGSPRKVLYDIEVLRQSMVIPPQIVQLVRTLSMDTLIKPLDANEFVLGLTNIGVYSV